jgi:hypothetical protein
MLQGGGWRASSKEIPKRSLSSVWHSSHIDVAPDGIYVTMHAAGIRSLAAELTDQEAPAPAASKPLLEAAE